MDEKKDTLEIWKERINKEYKRDDYIKACKKAGISTTTYQNAFKKTSFNDLTKAEKRFFVALMKLFDARKREDQKILQRYA